MNHVSTCAGLKNIHNSEISNLEGRKNPSPRYDNDEMSQKIFENFTLKRIAEIFLEEPEQNLFPPTQGVLAYKLLDWARSDRGGFLLRLTARIW